jgi:hypothetical protein
MRPPSLAARANVAAVLPVQARLKCGSLAGMSAQPRVHQVHKSEFQRPTQSVPFSVFESVTSRMLSGRLPSASSASDFWFQVIHVAQRTQSSQSPQHARAPTSHRLSPVARTGRQYPSPSAPQAHRPTVHRDVRCGQFLGRTGRTRPCLFAPSASVAGGPSVPSASERPTGR